MNPKVKGTLILTGILALGIVIGALGTGALRQEIRERHDRLPPRQLFREAIDRIVEPTREQRQELEATLQRRSAQIATIRGQHEEEIAAILDSMRTEMAQILEDEQLQRLEKHLNRSGRKMIERRLARLVSMLDLSEEQQKQIAEIYEKAAPFPEPGDRRPPPGSRREDRHAMSRKLRHFHSEIEALLTPEQLEKFRSMQRSERRNFPPPHRRGGPPF